MRKFLCVSAFALSALMAADRADLNGTWQLDPARSRNGDEKLKAEILSIDQKEDSIQITQIATETDGKKDKIDIECNTLGKTCKLKKDGQPAEVSLWFNGPILVLMETRRNGEIVVKKRLKASEDGKTLTLEVIHILPPEQKSESYTFEKKLSATGDQPSALERGASKADQ